MMNSGIYKISSKLKPERFYIGSAIDFGARRRMHFRQLNNNKHHSIKLQRHYNKYSKDDLIFEVLELVEDTTKLIEREQFYIDSLNPYFNISPTAGSSLGIKRSREYIEKQSKCRIGKKCSEETKQKMSKSHIGKNTWTKGNNMLGKHHSEESKRKISQNSARKGKHLTDEQKNHLSRIHIGKPKSEETKLKISLAKKGIPRTEQEKENISKKLTGRKLRPESIQKRQETRKRNQLNKISKII